jgi:acetyl-CoA/propionyl-CoA carboxylase carboxyl transferase subunit
LEYTMKILIYGAGVIGQVYGSRLAQAGHTECRVPRVTLITRKAYGGAYIAMNSHSLGATAVFAWPDAEIAVMGPEAAVDIVHRKALAQAPAGQREALRTQLIARQRTTAGSVGRAVEMGVVDEVIDPSQTRRKLAEALASIPRQRGTHGNIPI